MKLFPDSLAGWLHYGFVASIAACVGLLLYCNALTGFRWPPHLYIYRAAIALQFALGLLFLVSLALLPLNRRLAVIGLIASAITFGLYPIVTAIKEE
jgi:hypothetical protein